MRLNEKKRVCRCREQEIGGRLREGGEKKRKASLGNYWTRLGSWGNLSGTRSPRWWGCGRQDHMEGGLWLCSLKLVTRLLPSPWAECEMRLARPNVLHMHHLCHKTNLITVNYVAAIIRRGPATHTQIQTHTWLHAYTNTYSHNPIHTHLWSDSICESDWIGFRSESRRCMPPTSPGTLCIQDGDSSKNVCVHICMSMC